MEKKLNTCFDVLTHVFFIYFLILNTQLVCEQSRLTCKILGPYNFFLAIHYYFSYFKTTSVNFFISIFFYIVPSVVIFYNDIEFRTIHAASTS